ncbi:hypothetical protein NFX39_01375 [Fructobacillus sp. W13]|uniref:Uncharacterized protein n=1 Tax=Fructobacillus apis TaxID=2935017 RepID=A0ABT0ZP31_9LACO|nr:hypothetical protein [Fructobacillus apis]MCO0831745.1 hypothetical protein [Fructobacillus apis]
MNKKNLNFFGLVQLFLCLLYFKTGNHWLIILVGAVALIWLLLSFYVDKKEAKDAEMTSVARLVLKLKRRELKNQEK